MNATTQMNKFQAAVAAERPLNQAAESQVTSNRRGARGLELAFARKLAIDVESRATRFVLHHDRMQPIVADIRLCANVIAAPARKIGGEISALGLRKQFPVGRGLLRV